MADDDTNDRLAVVEAARARTGVACKNRAKEIAAVFCGNGLSHEQQTAMAGALLQKWHDKDRYGT